jgi:hypothetical protein
MRKLTAPPGTETLGQNLMAFVDNLQGSETAPIMKKHGLIDINLNAWYSAQMLLDALNEMAETSNPSANITAIGLKIGQIVPIPGDNPTLQQALMVWNDVYQSIHRGGDAGSIQCEKIAENHWKTTHSVFYPDDMSYGILYGYGRRFLPTGTHFKVFYDPEVKARDYGGDGDATIIHIQWE